SSCPGGRAAPQKCPIGTANQLTAQADITACQACLDGYISSETRAGCRLCPDGYLCDPHSGLQKSCNPGQYSPEGELECWECPQGYVCPDGRNRQHCSAGQEPNPSRMHCTTCTLGSFSTKETLGCQPCPAGHYCPYIGTIQPLPCPPGSCTDAPGQSECQRCNKSSCCLDTVGRIQQDHEPIESPEGLQCQPCPSGHFCAGGFTAPPCPAGSFEPRKQFCKPSDGSSCLPGIRQCLKCPTGYFCPAGASYPLPCQAGTYNPLQGQDDATDCRACPAGRVCTQAGLTQPDSECMTGGTYCKEQGAKVAGDCVPCPGGYHCPELGTVTPQACGAGSFSVGGNCFMLVVVQPQESKGGREGSSNHGPKWVPRLGLQ
ncbi:hypothetical protein G0U57_002170, partial [Chelydra serpentina]